MLANWGVPNYGSTVHSFCLNYLAALGRQEGFWAVSEYPVVPSGLRSVHDVQSDVVWFERPSGRVAMLGEVERWEPTRSKHELLRQKAENLAIAHHRFPPGPRLLVLAVWTTPAVPVRGLEALRNYLRSGFRDAAGTLVPPLPAEAELLTATLVLCPTVDGVVLREVLM